VTEAVVNAVAHRDYTENGSVQVMLFADRLEVRNPGRLPPPLTLEKLRVPHTSVPGNPLLARALYLVRYIEQMGTGTLDMIQRCVDAGLREPEFQAAGEFVTRIRRAAPAGQPVVFTDRDDVRTRTREKTGRSHGRSRSRPVTRTDHQAAIGASETDRETSRETDRKPETDRETGRTPTEKPADNRRRAGRERILALLRDHPDMTMPALAERMGLSLGGVRYHLERLKASGRVRRVGPTRGGRWKVLK
jgi:predicted HTH transcriptional regulator